MPKILTSTRTAFALLLLSTPLAFAKPTETLRPVPDTVTVTGVKSNVSGTTTAPVGGMMGQEGLNATAWVQTSTEAKIAARQAYFLAARELDEALKDPNWTAAVEQSLPFDKLPPAIILDLDETVLDNSFYQARLVRADAPYTSESWAKWVAQADALAIPGATEFLKYANDKGVQIYYVTNRSQSEEAATRANLLRLGLPVQGPADHVLTVGEMPDWTSDKTSRRRFVAQTNRVVLLIGDDMNDFVPAKPMSLQQRLDLLEKYSDRWGQRWILLSNPLYGSWEGALYDYQNGLTKNEMLKRKYSSLQTREPAATTVPTAPANPNATR